MSAYIFLFKLSYCAALVCIGIGLVLVFDLPMVLEPGCLYIFFDQPYVVRVGHSESEYLRVFSDAFHMKTLNIYIHSIN